MGDPLRGSEGGVEASSSTRRSTYLVVCLVVAAVAAVVLYGTRGSEGSSDGAGAMADTLAGKCRATEPDPVESLPPEVPRSEMSADEVREAFSEGGLVDLSGELATRSAAVYDIGDGPVPALLMTISSDSDSFHKGIRAGLSSSMASQGLFPQQVQLGGATATQFSSSESSAVAYLGRRSCYSIIFTAAGWHPHAEWMTAMVAGS